MLSFHEMEIKFGGVIAYQYLTEIEKTANIPSWDMVEIDPETRLANAIHMQDRLCGSALLAA